MKHFKNNLPFLYLFQPSLFHFRGHGRLALGQRMGSMESRIYRSRSPYAWNYRHQFSRDFNVSRKCRRRYEKLFGIIFGVSIALYATEIVSAITGTTAGLLLK